MAASRKRKVPPRMQDEEVRVAEGDAVKPTGKPPKESGKDNSKRTKLARTTHPKEKLDLEDLWKAAFLVGTEWDNMDKIHEINWKFSNLENAFEEGRELCGKKVYLFGCTEALVLNVNGMEKVTLIPIVVAVCSPVPPSDKIGVKSVMRNTEEIIPMKSMKMDWMPYIPLRNRQSQVERLHTEIYTMVCTQRRSALKLLKVEQVKQYNYCMPYLQPLHPEEDEKETLVHIMYPSEHPIVCQFDWELDDLEEFTVNLIKEETLSEDLEDDFKEYIKAQIKDIKLARRQTREARKKALEEMDPNTRSVLEDMLVYKFYPVQTSDTPHIISKFKVPYINRYYGKAHIVL